MDEENLARKAALEDLGEEFSKYIDNHLFEDAEEIDPSY